VFPAGHRIRLSISNAQWPMFWPTPYPVTTTLRLGPEASRLVLPVVPVRGQSKNSAPSAVRPDRVAGDFHSAPKFPPPVAYPGAPGFATLDSGTASGYGEISSVDHNPQTGEVTVRATNSGGNVYPWGTETYLETIEHRTSDANPAAASMRGTHRIEIALQKRTLLFEGELDFRSDATYFYYDYTRRVSENGVLAREKRWTETIPRDFQ
jgi:hypothetical protein